jgi:hypothetical protein
MNCRANIERALRCILDQDKISDLAPYNHENPWSYEIAMLIYDIFGGEILKTHYKNDWHFYNRINSSRIDLTKLERDESLSPVVFEDIPSSPDEIHNYFDKEDYLTLLMRFVRAFEEAVGLKKYRSGLIA